MESFIKGVSYPFWVQINPSFECNLTCPHCYVDHSKKGSMQLSIVEGLVGMIERTLARHHYLDGLWVSILGGEPTLFPGLAFNILERVNDIPFSGKKSIWLFTNGVELTSTIMSELARMRVFVILSTNESPLDFIEDRLRLIKEHQSVRRLSTVLTKHNLSRLDKIVESSLIHDYSHRWFTDRTLASDPSYPYYLIHAVPRAFELLKSFRGPRRRLDLLFDHMLPGWAFDKTPYIFGRRCITVDPDGSLWGYNCLRNVSRVGDLSTPDPINEMHEMVRENKLWLWSYRQACMDCEIKRVCQGGYPPSTLVAYGTTNSVSPFCKAFKIIVPKLIELYNSIPEERC